MFKILKVCSPWNEDRSLKRGHFFFTCVVVPFDISLREMRLISAFYDAPYPDNDRLYFFSTQLGLRNTRDLRHAFNGNRFFSAPILPAKIQSCGLRGAKLSNQHRRDRQVINGQPVVSHYPWMLALWVRTRSGFHIPTCGAALISQDYAITAAHCVAESSIRYIVRGGSNINHLTFDDGFGSRSGQNSQGLNIEVEDVIVHPEFNPFNFENDIAILRLSEPVQFSQDLFPICLPAPVIDDQITDYSGESALITGWGCETEGCEISNVPSVLQETVIPVISNELAMCW